MSLKILIVDQCSNSKKESELPDSVEPSLSREELVEHDDVPAYKARDLYEGRQQRYISSAVDSLRENGDETDRIFISAGYGVVDEKDLLPPYDTTFSGLSKDEIQERSSELGIQGDILDAVTPDDPYDVIFFALGKEYYQSVDMGTVIAEIPDSTKVVIFNGVVSKDENQNLVSIPARNREAKEQGTIVVALKGRYLQNFAEHRSKGAEVGDITELKEYCTTRPTKQSDFEGYD
jgi:hypothetical protein